jgi:hypothetical protein
MQHIDLPLSNKIEVSWAAKKVNYALDAVPNGSLYGRKEKLYNTL